LLRWYHDMASTSRSTMIRTTASPSLK